MAPQEPPTTPGSSEPRSYKPDELDARAARLGLQLASRQLGDRHRRRLWSGSILSANVTSRRRWRRPDHRDAFSRHRYRLATIRSPVELGYAWDRVLGLRQGRLGRRRRFADSRRYSTRQPQRRPTPSGSRKNAQRLDRSAAVVEYGHRQRTGALRVEYAYYDLDCRQRLDRGPVERQSVHLWRLQCRASTPSSGG